MKNYRWSSLALSTSYRRVVSNHFCSEQIGFWRIKNDNYEADPYYSYHLGRLSMTVFLIFDRLKFLKIIRQQIISEIYCGMQLNNKSKTIFSVCVLWKVSAGTLVAFYFEQPN